ncbi:MAG: ABC transporter permease [Bacteroidetes bacterium]|nr:ABC transporter permease [Bacteroidota bacterium]
MKSKALKVAAWEFMEKVKSKAFIISLILMPVIIGGMAVLPAFFASKEDTYSIQIGIIDGTEKLIEPLGEKLDSKYRLSHDQPIYFLRNLSVGRSLEEGRAEGARMIASDAIEGYFYIPSFVFDSGKIEYRTKNVGNFKIQERFSRVFEQVITEMKLSSYGLDTALVQELTARVEIKPIKISDKGEESETSFGETFAKSYVGLLMLIFMILTSGQLLVRSMVEEKSNRVIEVLLSSCTPRDIMVGKILGLSGLGVLQMLVYAVLGVALALKTNMNLLQPEYFAFTLVYAILGYVLYAAIFVAAGSPATTEQEAQQITAYISMLMVAPFALIMLVMQNPNSLLVKVLSYIPVLTPSVMVLRVAIQMPPAGEIFATILLLLVSIAIMMWIAGKIFRIAILSYGKRPSLSEIINWVREK